MSIASLAPSMPRPTYAVSSAPQGTFGAITPVTRLVAPAAAEIQRSGGGRLRPLAAVVALLSLLTGCREGGAVSNAQKQLSKEVPGLVSQSTPKFPSFGTILQQIANEGPKVTGELLAIPVQFFTNPVGSVVAAVLPEPIRSSSGGGASGVFMDVCHALAENVTRDKAKIKEGCYLALYGDPEEKLHRYLKKNGYSVSGLAFATYTGRLLHQVQGAGQPAITALGQEARTLTNNHPNINPVEGAAGVGNYLINAGGGDPVGAFTSTDSIKIHVIDQETGLLIPGLSVDTRGQNQDNLFTIGRVSSPNDYPVLE